MSKTCLLALSFLIGVPSVRLEAQNNVSTIIDCQCPGHEVTPSQLAGSLDTPDYRFSFVSDADQERGGGPWCYFNSVKNVHSRPVRIKWEAAMLQNNSLPSGETLTAQVQDPSEWESLSTPIYYGWGGYSITTTLFRPQAGSGRAVQNQPNGNSLIAMIDTSFADEDGQTYRIGLTFTSELERLANGYFRYSYKYANRGNAPVRVSWKSVEEASFSKAHDAKSLPGSTFSLPVIADRRSPVINRLFAQVFVVRKDGSEVEAVFTPAPAYVPR